MHILNESRGSTLEVVISRMKSRGTSVRFVMVSATVPNIQDIAAWVGCQGSTHIPAQVFEVSHELWPVLMFLHYLSRQFGEEYRPCKLTRHVIGVSRPTNGNDFQFAKSLDYKLFAALQKYSVGKPILVFCSSRKGPLAPLK